MIVFAHHSMVKDPPFSRLDLLVCRNFLIYLNPDMQKRLISLFHMVLKPGGVLFLGASETVGRHSDSFAPIDKKWKIFKRLESSRREDNIFPFSAPVRRLPRTGAAGATGRSRWNPPPWRSRKNFFWSAIPPPAWSSTRSTRLSMSPQGPTVLSRCRSVNRPGISCKMAREELRPALRAAIYKAFNEKKPVAFRGVKFSEGEEEAAVNVLVEPLKAGPGTGKLAMVILEPAVPRRCTAGAVVDENRSGDNTSKDMLIRQMEEQLRITHEQLQATTEQLETSQRGFHVGQ